MASVSSPLPNPPQAFIGDAVHAQRVESAMLQEVRPLWRGPPVSPREPVRTPLHPREGLFMHVSVKHSSFFIMRDTT